MRYVGGEKEREKNYKRIGNIYIDQPQKLKYALSDVFTSICDNKIINVRTKLNSIVCTCVCVYATLL